MSGRTAHDAALYVLGCLSAAEEAAFEEHSAGCSRCRLEVQRLRRVTSALDLLAPAVEPPAALRGRLLERVAATAADSGAIGQTQSWKNWAPTAAGGGPIVVPADAGRWEPTGVAGVLAKALFVDPESDRVTMLVRMEPGATYPAHTHGGPEESFILEGDLADGEVFLRAGDYLRKDGGTLHGVQSTRRGCLMLIVSSLHDEIVGATPTA